VPTHKVTAVIWDFDGTLADTLERNLDITRRIVERLLGGSAKRFPALRDRASYGQALHNAANWRELYLREFGFPLERTAEAAPLWSEFHGDETAVPPLFDGVAEVVRALSGLSQGIVSQNGRRNIEDALVPAGLLDHFEAIVADEDLPFHLQKPEPDGLLQCAEALHGDEEDDGARTVLYVGDHPVDVECVRRAAKKLGERDARWRVLSVGVEYGLAGREWASEPDLRAHDPSDVLAIVRRLDSG
jgi:phosphoglycolate phosphatase-like HAD superfamily hydrolase